jgi:hypothetical protein
MAGHVQSLLEVNNIDCHIRNMSLTGGIGELPINECRPEVWVNNDSDINFAEQLISSVLSTTKKNENWQCSCGEKNEGQFESCWACGRENQA